MGASANSNKLQNGYPTPGPQTPTSQKVMDHVFFMSEAQWKKAREENHYDLIIVGTGFCAYAVAKRALEKNKSCRILMIERGTFFLPDHFQNLPTPFQNTLGGMSETFPWSVSIDTARAPDIEIPENKQTIRWQHGMVPFFGGRSTVWSGWCPEPKGEEWDGWPTSTITAAKDNFEWAKKLLRVRPADEIDKFGSDYKKIPAEELDVLRKYVNRPVYDKLQKVVQERLNRFVTNNTNDLYNIYRTEPAPMAIESLDGIDFQKYSIPGELLKLVSEQATKEKENSACFPLDIVADCIVEQIINESKSDKPEESCAIALQTSRGVLPIGKAKLVLAMGTLPPTTLIQNSFPNLENVGKRFSAHFISSIIARVPIAYFEGVEGKDKFSELELGACYVAGVRKDEGVDNYKQQFHIQLSALVNKDPEKNSAKALRYMPDVVSTATMEQLKCSENHVVFVCAVLGELDATPGRNTFLKNEQDNNLGTNSLLRVIESESDKQIWEAMDKATFDVLKRALSSEVAIGGGGVEYWHSKNDPENPDEGSWQTSENALRVDGLVHESSTLHIGDELTEDEIKDGKKRRPVDLNYRLRDTDNVYITGGALWPQGGSWNPTLTMVALAKDLVDNLVEDNNPTGSGNSEQESESENGN